MVTGTVIVLALYALLETIISLLFSGAMWIAKSIMDSSVTVFSAGENMVETFVSLLPFSGVKGGSIISISSLMNGISYGVLVLVVFIAVIRSITSPVTGEDAENPVQIAVRVVMAIVIKTLIFGSGLFSFDGLLGIFGRWFGLILSKISESFNYTAFEGLSAGLTLNAAAYIGQLVLFASLLGSVLGAAITYIERILSFAVYVIIGPVAVSMYASKETENIAKEWILGIFTQFGAIAVSLLLWSAFLNQVQAIEGFYISGWQIDDLIFRLAVAIGILSLIKNSEKIFNMFGLRTMVNGESAKAIAGGAATIASGALMALRLAPSAKEGIARGMHGSSPAQGGRSTFGLAGNPEKPYTGNASLYDAQGNLSTKGGTGNTDNTIRRAVARSGGNFNSAITGPNSIRAAQNRQSSAVESISSAVKGQSAGYRVSGASVADNRHSEPKSYSGVQLGNLAISGHSEGRGNGFRFTGSSEEINRSSGISMHSSAAYSGTSDLVVGKTTALNGNQVSGVAGSGLFENAANGRISDLGTYFMPVEGGGLDNELATGAKVDLGDGRDWYVTGDGINIDDFGAKVYELETPMENIKVEIANTSEIKDIFSSSQGEENLLKENLFSEIVEEEEFGRDAYEENNVYDASLFEEDED